MTEQGFKIDGFPFVFKKPAYSVNEWAELCSVGRTTARENANAGKLLRRYPSSTPIIFIEDGVAWLRSLPTTPPERADKAS